MKRVALLLILIAIVIVTKRLRGQEISFSTSTASYTFLSNATSLNNYEVWEEPEYTIEIPFYFNYQGNEVKKIYVGDGDVYFAKEGFNYIAAFDADLVDLGYFAQDTSASAISYAITGEAPARILKIEWKNAGLFNDTTGKDFVNFQVWLYENSGNIEMHYGPASITCSKSLKQADNQGALIGYKFDNTPFITLCENPCDPAVATASTPAEQKTLNGYPEEGTVYAFAIGESQSIPARNNGQIEQKLPEWEFAKRSIEKMIASIW